MPARSSRACLTSAARVRYQCGPRHRSGPHGVRARWSVSSPNCREARVVTVPARPTSRRAPRNRVLGRWPRRSSLRPSPRPGPTRRPMEDPRPGNARSAARIRSAWRRPASAGSAVPYPVTSSVEPPPMSRIRKGPVVGIEVGTAPAIDSLASRFLPGSSGSRRSISPAASEELVAVGGVRGPPRWRPAGSWTTPAGPSPPGTPAARRGQRSMASPDSFPVASTPSPSLVIRIKRSRGRPSGVDDDSRVELVPQSMAATGPTACIGPCYDGDVLTTERDRSARPEVRSAPTRRGTEADPLCGPLTDRVLGSGEPPGQVGVKALDPLSGPTHSTPGLGPRWSGRG